jgi:hypothetical protein
MLEDVGDDGISQSNPIPIPNVRIPNPLLTPSILAQRKLINTPGKRVCPAQGY